MAAIVSTRIQRLRATAPRMLPVAIPASTPVSGTSPAGNTIGGISTTASTALTNSYTALGEVGNKLNRYGSDILSGNISFQNAGGFMCGNVTVDAAGNVSGTGMAMTQKGLVGVSNGQPQLAISYQGQVVVAGTIDTNSYVYARGATTATVPDGLWPGTTAAGFFTAQTGTIPVGVVAVGNNGSSGVGVVGWGPACGVYGKTPYSNAPAVWADGNLRVSGASEFNGTIQAGSNTIYAGAINAYLPLSYITYGSQANFDFSTDGGATWTPVRLRKA